MRRDVWRRRLPGAAVLVIRGLPLRVHLLPLLFLFLLLPLTPARAVSDGVIDRAREASAAGRRAEGIAMLEAHLVELPRDVDARLVYGLMLSWEGRYDDARRELEQVLQQAPGYTDARVALMNVEWWSGRNEAARAHARDILSKEAHHPQASLVEQRLGAKARPWTATSSYVFDWFDDDRDPWHGWALSIGRETAMGSIIVRGSHAERFRLSDQLIEVEMYPRFRAGTYAYVGIGAATKADLYPTYRVGVDLYQSLPWAFEVSAGYRRLGFSNPANIIVGSLTKYLGNWMLTARVNHVPVSGDQDSTSFFGTVRHYFGEAGTSFVGMRYGHGLSREEVRNVADLISLDSDSLAAEVDYELSRRFRVALSTGFSRQERATLGTLWQVTFGTSLSVRF